MLFALCTTTKLVSQRDLYYIARAVEICAGQCAKAWGLEAPAVEVCASPSSLQAFCQPVICTDKDEADSGFLAYHQHDLFHGTLSRAFVANATGIFDGTASLAESVAHEVLEALVDPLCDLWTHCPGRASNVLIAYEIGDPVQDSYVVRYVDQDVEMDVQVANFVHPAFFDDRYATPEAAAAFLAAGGSFDHLGTLKRAGQIGPEGYAVFKDGTNTWLEDATGVISGSTRPGARHPFSRTYRRLAA